MLTKPALNLSINNTQLTAFLDRAREEDERLRQQFIRENNERLVVKYLREWFRRTDENSGS